MWSFILHLRLKFQLLVAPAAFLLGSLFSNGSRPVEIVVQFFNVHILLLGGATVFNSFYDRDEGPVEGLRKPPPMKPWMLYASCAIQLIGLIVSFQGGLPLGIAYLVSILGFSFGYSHPAIRWKGRPIFSLFVIGAFGAITPFLMGFFSGGGLRPPMPAFAAMIGIALVVVAMFPLAQAHQIEEDKRRGDLTFSARYGTPGVKRLFETCYPLGIVLLSASFVSRDLILAALLLVAGLISGLAMWRQLGRSGGTEEDYDKIMRLKFASGAFLNVTLALWLGAKSRGLLPF
jgi:4-hydroxybenzoate polyprenyltransferase